jgi:streptomycin 6-kinase
MNLPAEFISIMTNTFGEEGEQLLADIPTLIDEVSTRWGLTDVQPVPNLSYNFVAFAQRGPENVVIKIGVPRDELTSEIAALHLFNGEGACRLIDADEEKGFLLLERLNPGVMLSTLKDDEKATHIAAGVMKEIWRPLDDVTPPKEHRGGVSETKGLANDDRTFFGREERSPRMTNTEKFIKLTDWFDGLKGLRQMFNGGTGPFNEKTVRRVERSVAEFFAENQAPVLMHGDFHHYNVLSSERGWQIIDPKGVIGPACYEVGPFLINPWGELIDRTDLAQITKRRIDILHEHLGFERERIHAWGLAHAILSAWWSMESNTGWEYAAAFAEMIADLHIK